MKRLLTNILIVSGMMVMAAAALAQSGQVRERLMDELQRTDEILIRAREAVISTSSSKAKLAYDQAVALQDKAKERFRAGPGGDNYQIAARLTVDARQRAQEAVSVARTVSQNESALLRLLERTDELMQLVQDALGASDDRAVAGMYQSARDQLDRAWSFYREQQYRASLKLAKQVERAARKMLEATNRDRHAEANYDRRLEEVRRFMEEVREHLSDCNSDAASQLAEQARRAFSLAERMAGEDNHQAALRALQNSREMAGEARAACVGEDNLGHRIDRLSDRVDRIYELVPLDNDAARTMLAQARQQIAMARDFLATDRLDAARAAAKAAQLMLSELQRQIESGGNR